jgi:hypothetical protein
MIGVGASLRIAAFFMKCVRSSMAQPVVARKSEDERPDSQNTAPKKVR